MQKSPENSSCSSTIPDNPVIYDSSFRGEPVGRIYQCFVYQGRLHQKRSMMSTTYPGRKSLKLTHIALKEVHCQEVEKYSRYSAFWQRRRAWLFRAGAQLWPHVLYIRT